MKFLLALLLGLAQAASAHEVLHEIAATNAAVVKLSYADGSPFAYEKFELYAQGQNQPQQVGNTDSAGRVAFVPGEGRRWRLRAFSADGHGVDLNFELAAAASAANAPVESPRQERWVFGLALILGAFGAYQLFLRKHNKK